MNDAYGSSMDEETYIKLSIIGALMLYLDFINIFLFLLRIFGRNNR
jgi:FtsH-binding integral membrane protein